ncbi:MAG: pyridoxal 5'-phosphate synthase glutaminase subunit PdxT [bacterium]|nr:pyridoxal 5'-phosphate synthase glutaminase subunit PdxT [bacterium]
MQRTIGILALQGAFAKHEAMLRSLDVKTLQIRKPESLRQCDGLVIPGGESTTLTKLMHRYGFYEPLREFARSYPIMGACAGTILLANEVDDRRVTPLQLMDIAVRRNAYGRQIDSFVTHVESDCLLGESTFRSVFIRAPKIQRVGSEACVLMSLQEEAIMVRQEQVLALTFHPELTDDPRIHQYFLAHM